MEIKEKSIIEILATACHEANRILCTVVDDYSQKHWEELTEEQKEISRKGVINVLKGSTSKELHDIWMENKIKDGWVYGPIKDENLKTHPSLIPYEQLSSFEQSKDYLFNEIAKIFLETIFYMKEKK